MKVNIATWHQAVSNNIQENIERVKEKRKAYQRGFAQGIAFTIGSIYLVAHILLLIS